MKKVEYGIILAAGNQKRFNSDRPKALVKYNDVSLLTYNVKLMANYVNKIIVAVNGQNYKWFSDVILEELKDFIHMIDILTIEPGYGCGDAAMQVLEILGPSLKNSDECILMWGDSIQDSSKLYELMINDYRKNESKFMMVTPITLEHDPYVSWHFNDDETATGIDWVKYSKSAKTDYGYRDVNIFMFNGIKTLVSLKSIAAHLVKYNFKYVLVDNLIKDRNGELELSDIVHYIPKWYGWESKILNVTEYGIKSKAFNTVEEYQKLMEEK